MQLDIALLFQNSVKIWHCLSELWQCTQGVTFFLDTMYIYIDSDKGNSTRVEIRLQGVDHTTSQKERCAREPEKFGRPHGIWLRETTFDRLTCLGWPYPQLKWQGPRGLKKIHYPLNIHTYMIWCRATNFGMVSHLGEGKVCRDWLHTHFQGAGAQSQNFSPCWRDLHTIWCKATSFGVVTYLVKGKCCRWSATPYNPRGGVKNLDPLSGCWYCLTYSDRI